ncbi:MAG: sensor histidine kinase [Verrucomicrobiaceae bacterium]
MPGSRQPLKLLVSVFLLLLLVAITITSIVGIRSIGRIDEINAASKELDERNLKFAPSLRSQIYRLHAAAQRDLLEHQDSPSHRYLHLKSELLDYLESKASSFNHGDEEELYTALRSKLTLFLGQLDHLREQTPADQPRFSAEIQETRDELIESIQQLGDSRRATFNTSVQEYKSLVDRVRVIIPIALVSLILSLLVIAWLARAAFLRPIQDSLAAAQKSVSTRDNLATIGTLASGVAHEIRNPITTIKARLFAMNELSRGNESLTRQVDAIQGETNRMERLIQDFLQFARPAETELQSLDLTHFLEEIHNLVTPEMNQREIAFQLGTLDPAPLRADSEQLKQVLLNLLRNAAEACLPEGGQVILSSSRNANRVDIQVSDNGSGIRQEHRSRVFDPFFSKKKGGTGLGLAICRNIIEAHHGSLTFESDEDRGTTFTISLPIA